jgi:hypothetical protein
MEKFRISKLRRLMVFARCRRLLFMFLAVGCASFAGTAQPSATSGSSNGILAQLAPDDAPPPSLKLDSAQRARAIPLLIAVKREEMGWRRELAAYLLATLGYEYAVNRDEILRVWREEGDDGNMGLLIDLYEQGHRELLHPLLARYDGWNAATTEGLGTFYGDELEKRPGEFLQALGAFSPARQLELCTAAGSTDGGGMGPEVERGVLANLKKTGTDVALRCARGVRKGNKDAAESNNNSLPSPPASAPVAPKHP